MVSTYVARLEWLISAERLHRYRSANADDLQTLTNYLWNVALSESLLQSISAVEIGLRNAIDRTFAAEFGSMWFASVLRQSDWARLVRDIPALHQPSYPQPTSGAIVSSRSLGFWLHFFERSYDPIWTRQRLKAVFPHHPQTTIQADWLTRRKIFDRLTTARALRNRAVHHEPIFEGIRRPDISPTTIVPLPNVHDQLLDLLDWIDPLLCQNLLFVDRFKQIYSSERARIQRRLEAHFDPSSQ